MRFSEISDRLIEDTNRRNKGEFYTPTLFVDYAHDMISKEFGEGDGSDVLSGSVLGNSEKVVSDTGAASVNSAG